MSERLIVNVDMDGVLANFDGALETKLIAAHPGIIIPDRHHHFYMSKRSDDPLLMERINVIKDAQGFFPCSPAYRWRVRWLVCYTRVGLPSTCAFFAPSQQSMV